MITVYLDVLYGHVMPEVAWSVQERVKKDVERFTGLNVDAVNVHVVRVTDGEEPPGPAAGAGQEGEDYA